MNDTNEHNKLNERMNRHPLTDNNDLLIAHFMASGRHEVPDRGFSDRVMRRLKPHTYRMAEWIVNICTLIVIGAFMVFDGFKLIFGIVQEVVGQVITNIDTLLSASNQMIVAAAILAILLLKRLTQLA